MYINFTLLHSRGQMCLFLRREILALPHQSGQHIVE